MGHGFLRRAGVDGLYWSCSGSASTNAYHLAFNASGVYSSNGPTNRFDGFSLRCLQEYELVRSGNVHVGRGYLWYAGLRGLYWSPVGSNDKSYVFFHDITNVNPSDDPYDRYRGFSLRCLQE